MNYTRCVYYDWSVTLPNNLQHKHNVLFSCLSAYFEVASSIAFSFVRTCEVPTSHDFASQSRATEFLGLHRITCRRVPCIGTCGQVSPPRLLFHNITKALQPGIILDGEKTLSSKTKEEITEHPTLLLSRARGFRSAASARPKIWDPPFNFCPFLLLVHSRGFQSIIHLQVTQAPIQWLSKLGKCDSSYRHPCPNYLFLHHETPFTKYMNMVGFIITASAHHYLLALPSFHPEGEDHPFTWGCMFGSPFLKCTVVLKLMICL